MNTQVRPVPGRKRALIVGSVGLVLVAVEVGIHALRDPMACVQVINEWSEPIEGLHVNCGSRDAIVPRIEPGASAKVYLAGRGMRTLRLRYRQRGNGLTGFAVEGFNPGELSREGFQLVITIRYNEFMRYQDDAEPSRLSRLGTTIKDWFERSLKPY